MHLNKLFFLCLIGCSNLSAQTGGHYIFEFLELSPSAKITSMGGFALSDPSSSAAIAFQNPALLNSKMHGQFQFQIQNYFAGISNGDVSYTHEMKKSGLIFQGGLHYLKSGSINSTDIYGNDIGTSSTSETNFFLSAGKKWNERIQTGLSLNYVNSHIDQYTANGIMINAGILYYVTSRNVGLSLVFRNLGLSYNSYGQTKEEKVPFGILLGFSKRLAHLPFIYHLNLQHLEQWNIRYDDPSLADRDPFTGEIKSNSKFAQQADNALRHVVIGGELLIGKNENFALRLGYNHLRNRELRLTDYRSFGGLCFGFGFKVYKFNIDYGFSSYHLAGGAHHFGISTNINSFLKNEI